MPLFAQSPSVPFASFAYFVVASIALSKHFAIPLPLIQTAIAMMNIHKPIKLKVAKVDEQEKAKLDRIGLKHLYQAVNEEIDGGIAEEPAPSVSRRSLLELCVGFRFVLSHIGSSSSCNRRVLTLGKTHCTFDWYTFSYLQVWIQVRGTGADVFFRDPVHLDENVSVEISSPSSSRFKEVRDCGSPDQAAQKVLKQYLTEFMSTRIGVAESQNLHSREPSD
ncbi:hypothetical protein L7F22_016788 [Adiantum nelumboides]|nr:hypothetical protein [Adiantum nelumboides]